MNMGSLPGLRLLGLPQGRGPGLPSFQISPNSPEISVIPVTMGSARGEADFWALLKDPSSF